MADRPNLFLHRGGALVSAEQLAEVPVPARTASWCPVAHHTLLAQVESNLTSSGLIVTHGRHALSQEGARYFGILDVRAAGADGAPDWTMTVGVRNSHDQSFPAGLCLGSKVFVCDNLAFSSEVVLARKHTSFILRDLPGLTMKAVGRLLDARGQQERRIGAYKAAELTDMQAHDLLIRACEAGALPSRWLMDAAREWNAPRHPEFAREGKTGWRLMNAVTEALKGSSDIQALPGRTGKLHGLLDAACQVFTRTVGGEARQVKRIDAEVADLPAAA